LTLRWDCAHSGLLVSIDAAHWRRARTFREPGLDIYLRIAFVRNFQQQAAGLAMNGVNLVALKPASRARIPHFLGPY
jgi:hypothetical protein